jgi:PPOX class probable FMN-dependent enzyme
MPTEQDMQMNITTLEELRTFYAAPQERAVRKQIAALDEHCRDFIGLSPFVLVATSDAAHHMDASPRGGAPGFVKVDGAGALLIPDSPGNNRLDTLENILATGRVGLLFLIPGFDETLRVNGSAVLSRADADIALCTTERRAPKLVIKVAVEAAYLHCAKAFLRSRLWSPEARVERTVLPTAGKMISDQTGIVVAPETREDMEKRYAPDL